MTEGCAKSFRIGQVFPANVVSGEASGYQELTGAALGFLHDVSDGTNRSRADIKSDDFDDKRPLTFDFGTPVTLLGAGGSEDHAGFRVVDSSILVGPALIRRGESLSLTLLAREQPVMKSRHTPVEVSLREKRSRRTRAGLTVPVVAALLVATNLAAQH